jgi:hypothetical protein
VPESAAYARTVAASHQAPSTPPESPRGERKRAREDVEEEDRAADSSDAADVEVQELLDLAHIVGNLPRPSAERFTDTRLQTTRSMEGLDAARKALRRGQQEWDKDREDIESLARRLAKKTQTLQELAYAVTHYGELLDEDTRASAQSIRDYNAETMRRAVEKKARTAGPR